MLKVNKNFNGIEEVILKNLIENPFNSREPISLLIRLGKNVFF